MGTGIPNAADFVDEDPARAGRLKGRYSNADEVERIALVAAAPVGLRLGVREKVEPLFAELGDDGDERAEFGVVERDGVLLVEPHGAAGCGFLTSPGWCASKVV